MSASPDFIPTPYPEWLTGCFYDGPQATDADRAAVQARPADAARLICLVCGEAVREDGHLPCGHDSI